MEDGNTYTLKICHHSIYRFYKLFCIQCWIMIADTSSISEFFWHFEWLKSKEIDVYGLSLLQQWLS